MATQQKTESGGMFGEFFRSEVSGAIILIGCTVAALVWANSPWSESYYKISHTYIGLSWSDHAFKLSLSHWIKDGLMAIFFLGIILGLVLGKQIGILGACWLALRSGRCDMPRGVGWAQLWGASCLAGIIGFVVLGRVLPRAERS